MEFRYIRLNIFFRVIALVAFSISFAFVIINTDWIFTPLLLGIGIVISTLSLVRYSEKITVELKNLLLNIRHGGFNASFKSTVKNKEIGKVFDELLEEFEKVSFERETHLQFLKTINENLEIGLISYDDEGKIEIINPSAKRIFNKSLLLTIDGLKKLYPDIYTAIVALTTDKKEVLKTEINNKTINLLLHKKLLKIENKSINILLIHRLDNEIDIFELDAWQKLVSVLTHEIMNSVTPISSLSGGLKSMIETIDPNDKESMEDITTSIETIENRSKSLLKFIKAYKNFTRPPIPKKQTYSISESLFRIYDLLLPEMNKRSITFKTEIEEGVNLFGDVSLIEQVVINLIKNAEDAVKHSEGPEIKLILLKKEENKIRIIVEDNGKGISQDILDKIFIPFFTTKSSGNGIGLSLSRQLLRAHSGYISAESEVGKGTRFIIDL